MAFSTTDVRDWLISKGWKLDSDTTNTQYPWIPPGASAPGVYGINDAMQMQFNWDNNGQGSATSSPLGGAVRVGL